MPVTTRLKTPKRTMNRKADKVTSSGLPPANFYSPKTPGWVSGKDVVFLSPSKVDTPDVKGKRTRRSVYSAKEQVQKPADVNNRRRTMAFKAPPPLSKSPVNTRARRSSMFGVSNSKGGIRLNIAITPQEKRKGKIKSPPEMPSRAARRSSVYKKDTKLSLTSEFGKISKTKSPEAVEFSPVKTRSRKTKPDASIKTPEKNDKITENILTTSREVEIQSTRKNKTSKSDHISVSSDQSDKESGYKTPKSKGLTSHIGNEEDENTTPFKTPAKSPSEIGKSNKKAKSVQRLTKPASEITKSAKKTTGTLKSVKTPSSVSKRKHASNGIARIESPIEPPPKKSKSTPKVLKKSGLEMSHSLKDSKSVSNGTPEIVKEMEDAKKLNESMTAVLKKKAKTPKVMIVSPPIVTPVRPPRRQKRKATPGRVNVDTQSEMAGAVIDTKKALLAQDDVTDKDMSLTSMTSNDLSVNTTSHSSKSAKCVIL